MPPIARPDVTVVITTDDGLSPCLDAPGLRDLVSRADVLVLGDARAVAPARRVGVRYAETARPGRAAARNAALDLTEAPLIAFLDGHCRPAPGWLDVMRDAMHDDAGVLGRTVTPGWPSDERWALASDAATASPVGGIALYDRCLLQQVGGFDPAIRYWDDLYAAARMRGSGFRVSYAPNAVACAVATRGRGRRLLMPLSYGYELQRLADAGDLRNIPRATSRRRLVPRSRLDVGRLARVMCGTHSAASSPLEVRTRAGPGMSPDTVHLTIDDGPSANTAALLDILRRYGARADFFVVGKQARRHPEVLASLARHGHGVHNHSMTHRRFDGLGTDDIAAELDAADRLLPPRQPGERVLVRLPYGAGVDDHYVHNAIRRWHPRAQIVQWDLDSEDYKAWQAAAMTPDLEREALAAATRLLAAPELPGSIVLMHDCALGGGAAGADAFARVLLGSLLTGFRRLGLTTCLLNAPGG